MRVALLAILLGVFLAAGALGAEVSSVTEAEVLKDNVFYALKKSAFSVTFTAIGSASLLVGKYQVVLDDDDLSIRHTDGSLVSSTLLTPTTAGKHALWVTLVDGELAAGQGTAIYANHKAVATKAALLRNVKSVTFQAGSSVSNVVMTDAVSNIMEFTAPQWTGKYEQFNQPQFLPTVSTDGFVLKFEVMGSDEASIAFLPSRIGQSADAYEVTLGKAGSLHHGTGGAVLSTASWSSPMKPDSWTPYWITLSAGVLTMGRGAKVSEATHIGSAAVPALTSTRKLTLAFAGSAQHTAAFRINVLEMSNDAPDTSLSKVERASHVAQVAAKKQKAVLQKLQDVQSILVRMPDNPAAAAAVVKLRAQVATVTKAARSAKLVYDRLQKASKRAAKLAAVQQQAQAVQQVAAKKARQTVSAQWAEAQQRVTKQAAARSAKHTAALAAKAKRAAAKARAAAKRANAVHSQRLALATATVGEPAAAPVKKEATSPKKALRQAIVSREANRTTKSTATQKQKATATQKQKVTAAKVAARRAKAKLLARKAAARKAAAIKKRAAKQEAAAKKAAVAKKAAAKRAAVARVRIAAKKAAARVTSRNVEKQTKGAARSLSKAATLLTGATQRVQASGRRAHMVHQVVQKLQERLADLDVTSTKQRKAAAAVQDLAGYTHRLMATVQKTLQKTRRAARDVKSASVAVRSGRARVNKWKQPVPVKDVLRAKQGSLKFTRQAAIKAQKVATTAKRVLGKAQSLAKAAQAAGRAAKMQLKAAHKFAQEHQTRWARFVAQYGPAPKDKALQVQAARLQAKAQQSGSLITTAEKVAARAQKFARKAVRAVRTAAAKAKEAVQVAATAKATVQVLKAQRAALKLASTLPALQHAQFKAAHAVQIAKQALEATDDDTAESTRAEKALAQAKAAEKLATERVRAARAAVKKSHGSVAQAIKKAGAAAVVAAVRKGVAATHSAVYHAKKAGAAAKAVAKQAILVSKRAATVAALVAAAEGKPVVKAPQTVDSLLSAMQAPAKKPLAAKQAAQPIQARATPSDAVSKKTAPATKSKTPKAKEVKEVKVAPLPKATAAPRLQKAAQAAKAHLANMKKVAQLMPNNPVAQAALVKAGHKVAMTTALAKLSAAQGQAKASQAAVVRLTKQLTSAIGKAKSAHTRASEAKKAAALSVAAVAQAKASGRRTELVMAKKAAAKAKSSDKAAQKTLRTAAATVKAVQKAHAQVVARNVVAQKAVAAAVKAVQQTKAAQPASPLAANPKPAIVTKPKPAVVAKPAVAKPAVAKPAVAKPAVAKPSVAKPAAPVKPTFTFATATASGDPHVDTFDGKHHDTMVQGWFTWVKNPVVHIQAYSQLGCMPASTPNTCMRAAVLQITPPGSSDRLTVAWGSWPGAPAQNVVIQDSTGAGVNVAPGQFKGGVYFNGRYKVDMKDSKLHVSPVGAAAADPALAVSAAWGQYFLSVTLPKAAPHMGATNGLMGFFNGNGQSSAAAIFRQRDGSPAGISDKMMFHGKHIAKPVEAWAASFVVSAASGVNPPIALDLNNGLKGFNKHHTYLEMEAALLLEASSHLTEFSLEPRASKPQVFATVVPAVTPEKQAFCTSLLKGLIKNKKAYAKQHQSCLMDAEAPSVARSIATVIKVARAQKKAATKALVKQLVKQQQQRASVPVVRTTEDCNMSNPHLKMKCHLLKASAHALHALAHRQYEHKSAQLPVDLEASLLTL